jgi:hypothetical protein
VRVTVMVAAPAASLTVYAAAENWTTGDASVIVTRAREGVPRDAPVAEGRLTKKDSFGSMTPSSVIGTVNALVMTPAANVSVPLASVKSLPARAVSPLVA